MRSNGFSGSRDDWKKSGQKGGLLMMHNAKFFGKQRGEGMVKETAVKAEDRSSFQQLRAADDAKGNWDERPGDPNV